jgi:hypothetical protein
VAVENDRMGAGESIPERLDEDAVKLLAGIHFDKNIFDALQLNGLISRQEYLRNV